jgi:hypothetical protein
VRGRQHSGQKCRTSVSMDGECHRLATSTDIGLALRLQVGQVPASGEGASLLLLFSRFARSTTDGTSVSSNSTACGGRPWTKS